ncbi:DCL family protein [Streptomyces bacillaris]|uniref:DCL family protein n=1 Tax=Streptomyces bacillaris TaxID=68179 RepID=UPI003EC05775
MPKSRCWIGDREYASKGDRAKAVQEVLYRYPAGNSVNDPDDDAFLRDLLAMHPDSDTKTAVEITGFRTALNQYGKQGFIVVRPDGTTLDFSYKKCLDHPNYRARVLNAMRVETDDDTTAYFTARQDNGTLVSDLTGAPLDPKRTYVAYFLGPAFVDIATEFAAAIGGWAEIQLTDSSTPGIARFTDRVLAERWRRHHNQYAALGLRAPDENPRDYPTSA